MLTDGAAPIDVRINFWHSAFLEAMKANQGNAGIALAQADEALKGFAKTFRKDFKQPRAKRAAPATPEGEPAETPVDPAPVETSH